MKYIILKLISVATLIILSREVNYKTEITITIIGSGNKNILSDINKCYNNQTNFSDLPQEIIINGINQTIKKRHHLNNLINNITMKWDHYLTNCNNMFNNLTDIINFDFSKFDTSTVTSMACMFLNCTKITSINVSNFNTSLVTNMDSMFSDCRELKSLDLSNFDTSSVTNMHHMIYQCFNLISLNVENFNTSKVVDMTGMFEASYSLKSLEINHFDTSSCTIMYAMFHLCTNLTSLDLINFDSSKVTSMGIMFNDCYSLKYLNLYNFNTTIVTNVANIFKGINSSSLTFCFNITKTYNISKMLNHSKSNCSFLCLSNKNKKLIKEKDSCLDECKNDDTYKFEYNRLCYTRCPNGTHNSSIKEYFCEEDLICDNYYNYNYTGCLDEIPIGYYMNDSARRTINKCNIKCENCTNNSTAIDLCISCNSNNLYYPKINDSFNRGGFIECYNETPDGYFLDNNIYKPYVEDSLNILNKGA